MPELRQVMFVFEEDGATHTGFAPYDLWSQHRPAAGVAERAFDRDSDALLDVAAGKAHAGHVTSQGHVRLSADDYAPATAGWPAPRD